MLYSQANFTFGSQTGRNGRGEPYVVLAVAAVPSISRGYFVVRATPLMDRLGVVAPLMQGGAWDAGRGGPHHMHSLSPPQPLSHQQRPSSSPSCEWKIEAIIMQQPPCGGTSEGGGVPVPHHVDPMDDTLTRQDTLLSHLSLESPFPSPTVEFISCVTHDECPPVSPQAPHASHQPRGGGAPLPPLTLGNSSTSSPHDEMEREVATIVVVFKHADQADPQGGHGSPGCGPSQLAFLLSRNVMAFSIFRFSDRNHRVVGIPSKQGVQRPLYTYAMSQLADDVISPWPDELLGSLKSAKKGCSPAGAFPLARHISPESELGVSLNYHLNSDASALTIQVYAKGADVEAVRGARKAAGKPASVTGPAIGKKGMGLYETVGISTVVLLRGDTSPPRPIRTPAGSPDNGARGGASSPLGVATNTRGRRGETHPPAVPITPTNNGAQTATTGSCPVFLAAALFPDISVSSIHSAGVPSASEQGYSIIAGCVESATDSILLLSRLQASCRREAGQPPLPTSHLTLRSFSQDTSRGAFFVLADGGKTTCCMIDPTASYVAAGTSLGRVFLVHFANNGRNGKVGEGEITHIFMTSVPLPLHLTASVSHCSVVSLYPTKAATSKKTTKRKLMLLAVSKSSKGCLFTGTVDGAPDEGSGGGVSLSFYGELAGKLRGCQFFTPCSQNVIQIHSKFQPTTAPSDASPESPSKTPHHHSRHQFGSPHNNNSFHHHSHPEASDRALVCMMLVPQLEANIHCISLSEDTASPFAPKQRSSDRTLCGNSSLVLALRERRKVNVTSVRTAYESDVGTFMGTGTASGGVAAGSPSHDAYAKLAYVPLLFVGTPLQWRDPLMAAFNNPNDDDDRHEVVNGTTSIAAVREDVPWVTPITEIPVVAGAGGNLAPTPNGTTKTFLHTTEGLDVNADERCMDDTDPYLHHIKPLGSGTFGAVTLAVSRAFPDRSFAVKRVRKMSSDNEFDQNMVRTFFQEALNVLTSIPRHDNVVKYYGIYDSSTYHNIVMELARHGSLDEALFPAFEKLPTLLPTQTEASPPSLSQNPKAVLHVPEPVLINWLGQGLHGLNHLHTHGVVHRDVKAGNILLSEGLGGTTDRRLLWTDFGVSCVEGARSDNNAPSHTSAKTAMRTVIGTMGFTAPELLEHWGTNESARYSAVCDVWGLGVVFYCYITGIGWLTEGGCIGVATAPQEITDVCAGRLPTLLELKRAAEARYGGDIDGVDGGAVVLGHSPAVSGIDGGGSSSAMRGFSIDIQYVRVLQLSDQFLTAIDAMMRVNREERITTANALRHPLFCESWLSTTAMSPTVTPSIHFHNERWEVCKKSIVPALAASTASSHDASGPNNSGYKATGGLLLLSETIRSFNPPSSQQPQGGMLLLKVLVACTAQEEASEALIRWMGCLITARNLIRTNVIGAPHMHPRILLPSQLERTISECNLRRLPRDLRLRWSDFCKHEFTDPPTLPASSTTPTTTTFGSSCILLGCVGQCDPFPTNYTAFEETHPLLTISNYAPFKEAISQWKSLISNWGTHGRSALYPSTTSASRDGGSKTATNNNSTDDHTSSDLTVAATELLQECVVDAVRAALASYRHALAASFLSDPACHHMVDIEGAFYHGGVVRGNVSMACPPPRILILCEAPLASVIGLAARSIVIGPPSIALTAQKAAHHGDNNAGGSQTPTSSAAPLSVTSTKSHIDHDLSDAALLLYDAGFHFGNRWSLASCLEALERG